MPSKLMSDLTIKMAGILNTHFGEKMNSRTSSRTNVDIDVSNGLRNMQKTGYK